MTMVLSHIPPVLPTNEARVALTKALARFREQGALAEPVVFGAQRRPEGVMIPFELYEELLPVIEDLEIAHLARARAAAGESIALSEVAAAVGLDPDDYR
ncbi:hypothetical protein [Leifsonia sp. 22587]|uniref:hypothetical protein n=1 Tax=Leifsonia sp. 22587 TaxID=3453946 RepID=UPI003F86C5CD